MRLKLYSCLVGVLLLASCANRGIGPQGGPRDTIPPVPVKSMPENGVLNFQDNKIEITFNEYLELNDLANNLLMSPPQQHSPEVKVRGKRLVIQFQDSLYANTTYTLDFGDAICDYHERIPAHNYTFSFSTGDVIDTLELRGQVFDAANLNPLKGVIVGVHENKDDSAFTTMPFLRIARTDSVGRFRIGNIREGKYRLYAVNDVSRDYRLTPGEALAFADESVDVISHLPLPVAHSDSAQQDSAQVEEGQKLFLFQEEQKKLYLQRTLRQQQHRIQILFSSSPDSVPELRPLVDSLNYIVHYSSQRDTVTMWLVDSASILQDSIFIEARYRRTDSLFRLEWCTDTLRAIWREPRMSAKAKEAQARANRNRRLELKSNARQAFEIYDTLCIRCTTPLASIERDSIHLYERVDTILKPVAFEIASYDTLPMSFMIVAKLKPKSRYEVHLDSAALHDIYGITHKALVYKAALKSPEDYSTLRVKLRSFDPQARIQVLSAQDKVIRELPAKAEGALFEYLRPDTYYLRLYIDSNGDGKWTTGSWKEKRQPEAIYYFPGKIQTKSNWDFEEEWDHTEQDQTATKPKELIKASAGKK